MYTQKERLVSFSTSGLSSRVDFIPHQNKVVVFFLKSWSFEPEAFYRNNAGYDYESSSAGDGRGTSFCQTWKLIKR